MRLVRLAGGRVERDRARHQRQLQIALPVGPPVAIFSLQEIPRSDAERADGPHRCMRGWPSLSFDPVNQVRVDGEEETGRLPGQAGFQEDLGAERQGQSPRGRVPALCHPEACGHPPALRPSPRARRRLQVLGGDQGPLAQSRRQAPGRRGGGPPARLRRLRRARSPRASMAAAP